jgi:hypothetical protein
VKRRVHITATEIAETCVCEQRIVFDHLRGKRRTGQSHDRMRDGAAVHATLHRDAVVRMRQSHGGGRGCVASSLWGTQHARTQRLPERREPAFLRCAWGRALLSAYDRISPALVGILERTPILRWPVGGAVSLFLRLMCRGRE